MTLVASPLATRWASAAKKALITLTLPALQAKRLLVYKNFVTDGTVAPGGSTLWLSLHEFIFDLSLPLRGGKGYKHGQTSWDTSAFIMLSLNHTCPTLPHPINKVRRVSRIVPKFQLCVGWGGGGGIGELQDIFKKQLHCFIMERRNCRTDYEYFISVPMIFVQDCWSAP